MIMEEFLESMREKLIMLFLWLHLEQQKKHMERTTHHIRCEGKLMYELGVSYLETNRRHRLLAKYISMIVMMTFRE